MLVTKVIPMLLAFCHLINNTLSFYYYNVDFLSYFASVSFIFAIYLYIASYAFKLCEYYRMFLHYCIIVNTMNIIDYYIGIPLSDTNLYILFWCITIVSMFITLYLKIFKR